MAFRNLLPSAPELSDVNLLLLASFLSVVTVVSLVYLTSFQLLRYFSPLRKLPYPPGPPPRDIILGNARDLFSNPLWGTFTDWSAIYGSIMHLKVLDRHMLVVNSIDDAVELMEKRSNNYSDRPYFPMLDLAGASFATPLKLYQDPAWRAHRRIYQKLLRPSASLEYRPMQIEKVNDMLCSLLETPEDFITHIKTLSVATVMSSMYGYKVLPKHDPFQELAEATGNIITQLTYPSAAIVNILPFLRFLPTWFPGANFHRVAAGAKEKVKGMVDFPYKYVRDNMASGTASPSFVAGLLETCKSEEDHMILRDVSATAYVAGAETTTSAISTFIYAMAKFPDIQKKAQEELDKVVGHDRLVNYNDEGSLPYIQAVTREVLRWRPIVPLGFFHASSADDVYKGYHIPAGTTIVPNMWAMTRDPLNYNDPEDFNPGRFFNENGALNSDDVTYTFGFGRRICPGRHMATATIWLAIATVLSTFDIRPHKDSGEVAATFNVEYSGSLVSQPYPFECVITPRSIKAKQLIVDIRNTNI